MLALLNSFIMTAPAFRLRILPFPTIVEYKGMVILTWQSSNGNRWTDKIGRFMNEGGVLQSLEIGPTQVAYPF